MKKFSKSVQGTIVHQLCPKLIEQTMLETLTFNLEQIGETHTLTLLHFMQKTTCLQRTNEKLSKKHKIKIVQKNVSNARVYADRISVMNNKTRTSGQGTPGTLTVQHFPQTITVLKLSI